MTPILLLVWLLQGIPVLPAQGGTITGTLRNATGGPAAGVRVSAMARPDSPQDASSAASLASIAETDDAGRYKLENIPPGRYYIVAGRIDVPTFYPGTLDMTAGTAVQITPGVVLSGMDFEMKANSAGRADPGISGLIAAATAWTVPLQVAVDNGKIPISDAGLFPVVRVTRVSDGEKTDVPLTAASLMLPVTPTPEYRVTIENLSSKYVVKSIVSDSTNLMTDPLRLQAPHAVTSTTVTAALSIFGSFTIVRTPAGTSAPAGTPVQQIALTPLPPVKPILVTIAQVGAPSPRSGTTITGDLKLPFNRSIYISGTPGAVYTDGTFEFRNVLPGRHTILTRDNPAGTRPIGASLVVGDQDIRGVALQQILETPLDPEPADSVLPGESHTPGSIVSLASVRGRLLNEATGQRIDVDRTAGRVTVNGNTVSYTINNVGEFDIQSLLPGRYNLELWIFGGKTYTRTIVVGDENIDLEWAVSVPD